MFRKNSSRLEHRGGLRRSKSTGSVGTHMRRSKSTGSVGTHHLRDLVSIEPQSAHRDAHIAARISFTKAWAASSDHKAQLMANTTSSSACGLSRSHSFMSGPDVISCATDKAAGDVVAQEGLSRQTSVRFTGPAAQKKRHVASRAHENSTGHDTSSLAQPEAFVGRLPRSAPMPHRSYDQSWVEDCTFDSSFKHEDTICGSELSIYSASQRKLRKSHSMLTSSFMSDGQSESTMQGSSDWNSHAGAAAAASSKHAVVGTGKSSLRSPKSMSFLRLSSSTKGQSMKRLPKNSMCASTSKLSLSGSMRLKSRPSIFFRSKNARNASLNDLKTSMRNSSNNSMPIPSTFSSTPSSLSKGSGLKKAARKVSKSVKNTIRGMFGRTKKPADTTATLHPEPSSMHHSQTSLQEEASFSRVRSYVPSLRSVASEHCLHPRQGSFEMADDATQQTDGERSRVTSWTNSSTHTVVSNPQDAEWEPQRLSVIDEGGHMNSTMDRWKSSQDEERAYSALVQRLDDMQKQQRKDANQGGTLRGKKESCSNTDQEASTSTSYLMAVETSMDSSENNAPSALVASEHGSREAAAAVSNSEFTSRVTSPVSHLSRTQSPYQTALRQSMRSQNLTSNITPLNMRYLTSLSALSLPTRRSSPDGSEPDVHLSSTESVYSCPSEEHSNDRAVQSPERHSSRVFEEKNGLEDGLEKGHRREVSTASSVEWKTWLSAKMSELEDGDENSPSMESEDIWNPWTGLGHVRENTEIEPNSTPSDGTDSDGNSDKVVADVTPMSAAQTTQNIIIDDNTPLRNYLPLTYNENSHPGQINHQRGLPEDEAETPKATIRSVSSLPHVNPSEGCEAAYRPGASPQGQKISPLTLSESANKIKKSYLKSTTASSLKSSPGLSIAAKKKFGTVGTIETGSPRRRSIRGGEDVVMGRCVREVASFDDSRFGKGLDAQVMGSKRMVELFLNSRKSKREAVAGQDEEDGRTPEWSRAFV